MNWLLLFNSALGVGAGLAVGWVFGRMSQRQKPPTREYLEAWTRAFAEVAPDGIIYISNDGLPENRYGGQHD